MSDNEVHLKEHLELLIEERFQRVQTILDERQRALILTADGLRKELDHLNALRQEVVKIEGTLVGKDGCAEHRRVIVDRIAKLENFQSRLLGIGIVYGLAAGVIGAIAGHVFIK